MLAQLLPILILHSSAVVSDRMVRPAPTSPMQVETIGVRVSSPNGVLWQGNLRVSQNQGASYSQNLSQSSPTLCPPNSPFDRSERSSLSFNVYVQNSGELGFVYRIDASWGRPAGQPDCGERGTRTVQVNQALALDPGETGVVEGDAGLRVEVTRPR
ncbi:MAG: hypothetical protein HOP96_05210 [Sphingomonas sp.]|nr:hypothetical protein [Sphingomonas sp.]